MNQPADDHPTTETTVTPTPDSSIPEPLKDVTLAETFLPESQEELQPGQAPAKTPEEIAAEKNPEKPTTETPTTETPVKPTEPTNQPKNTQNEEVIDKTVKPKEDVLLAGKYKTVEELKHGIEELGGDHTGITDTKMLEQVYKVAQASFTKWQQRQQKAQELATTPKKPKGFEVTDDFVKQMVDQIDFNKVEDMRDVADAMFRIMFSTFQKSLPEMLPKQAPAIDPVEMAAQVEQVKTATDALGFIEAKVPRLVTDTKFRNSFATFVKEGKEAGTYPKVATRETLTKAMRDFQQMLADMAGAKLPDDTATQEKNATVTPEAGGSSSVETTPDPEDDILGGILGAKTKQDQKFA